MLVVVLAASRVPAPFMHIVDMVPVRGRNKGVVMTDVSTVTPRSSRPKTADVSSVGRCRPYEQSLLDLIHVCFGEYWNDIWFGIIMEGAAWEVVAPNAPKLISVYDGYVTVDFGRWHFHLCIGEHREMRTRARTDPQMRAGRAISPDRRRWVPLLVGRAPL